MNLKNSVAADDVLRQSVLKDGARDDRAKIHFALSRSNLHLRVVTASLLIAVFVTADVLAAYFSFGRYALAALGAVASVIGAFEAVTFSFKSRLLFRNVAWVLYIMPLLATAFFVLRAPSPNFGDATIGFAAGFSGAAALLFVVMFSLARTSLDEVTNLLLSTWLGFVFLAVGSSAWIAISLLPQGGAMVAWLLLVVCLNDIAAYGVGRVAGGPKLAPAISPGKTIAGALGGIVAGAGIGALTHHLLGASVDWPVALSAGGVITIAAQSGDIAESLLKRLSNVKDSGTILPGHGGVLDRIDGILGGMAALYCALLSGLLSRG